MNSVIKSFVKALIDPIKDTFQSDIFFKYI